MPKAAVLGQIQNARDSAGRILTAHFASPTTFSRQIAEKYLSKNFQVRIFGFAHQAHFEKFRIMASDSGSWGKLF